MFFTTAVRAPMGSSRLMSPGLSSATVEERKRSGKGAEKERRRGGGRVDGSCGVRPNEVERNLRRPIMPRRAQTVPLPRVACIL